MSRMFRTDLRDSIWESLESLAQAEGQSIGVYGKNLLTEHVKEKAAEVKSVDHPSHPWNDPLLWGTLHQWLKDNPVLWSRYKGKRSSKFPTTRRDIYRWADQQRWLQEGDSAYEPAPEPCDEVDNCAKGKHGEECQSYSLAPFDAEDEEA